VAADDPCDHYPDSDIADHGPDPFREHIGQHDAVLSADAREKGLLPAEVREYERAVAD
jgi:hypothetical protein